MIKHLKKRLYFKKLAFYLEQSSCIIIWWTDKKTSVMLDTMESSFKQDSLSISKVLWQKNSIIFRLFFKKPNIKQKGSYFLTTIQPNTLEFIDLIYNQKLNDLFVKEKNSFVGFLYTPEYLFFNQTRLQFVYQFYLMFKWFLTAKSYKLKLLFFFIKKFIIKLRIMTFLIFRNNVLFLKCL